MTSLRRTIVKGGYTSLAILNQMKVRLQKTIAKTRLVYIQKGFFEFIQ